MSYGHQQLRALQALDAPALRNVAGVMGDSLGHGITYTPQSVSPSGAIEFGLDPASKAHAEGIVDQHPANQVAQQAIKPPQISLQADKLARKEGGLNERYADMLFKHVLMRQPGMRLSNHRSAMAASVPSPSPKSKFAQSQALISFLQTKHWFNNLPRTQSIPAGPNIIEAALTLKHGGPSPQHTEKPQHVATPRYVVSSRSTSYAGALRRWGHAMAMAPALSM